MKSLIDYGTSLTFYLGIIFIVVATLIYVRKRINDLDAKANSMFDIISTMAREIQYMKAEMSGGGDGGHPQGMNLETALNSDDNTKDVLMSHFQAGVTGDESSDDSDDDSDDESDDESSDDESGNESGDESGNESGDDVVDVNMENMTSTITSNINDIDDDEDNEGQHEDNEGQQEDNEGQHEDNEGQQENDDDDEDDDEDDGEDEDEDEDVKLIDFNESSIIDSELNDVDLTDYTKKTTKELKELVSTKGLATEVNKLKRPQLIKLLQK